MMFLTMTAAQLLVYMTTVCPSKVETLPEQNMTIVYKCISNPLMPKPSYPPLRDKDQSRVGILGKVKK